MQEPIAIVGIACRFPAASNPQAFWQLLREGREAIKEIPPQRWDVDIFYDPDPTRPAKTTSRWGGFLDQVDQFDWRAFRISPREARYMDPQHRLLLELGWEALEDAGIPLHTVAGSKTSVSIGIGWSDYFILQARDWSQLEGYTTTGSASCFAANRLSYAFDLQASSVSLDTGCSSSLSALHLACQNLWTQEANLALAGGVHLMLSPMSAITSSKSGLLAHDGRCKTLDAQADGFVNGEGAGLVVLKRLSDVQPTDRIYALINAVSVNHNGHNKWIMGVSKSTQETLLRDAYHKAGIDPAHVDYVELHGTGFLEGDAIETQALGAVLGAASNRTHPCLVGSVKTNLGHLANAAGMAGVIKTALALYHGEIPPTLHVQSVNPNIHLRDLSLDIPQATLPWPHKDTPKVAGVSTISLSGANAHAVLSAVEQSQSHTNITDAKQQQPYLLLLSALSEHALRQHMSTYRDFLCNAHAQRIPWGDICYTASVRRTHHPYRLALISTTAEDAAASLDAFLADLPAPNIHIGLPDKKHHTQLTAEAHDHTPATPLPYATESQSRVEVLNILAILYTHGQTLEWNAYYHDNDYHCVSLPNFPWQRDKLWLDGLHTTLTNEISTDTPITTSSQKQTHLSTLPTEQILAILWSEVLGLETVDTTSNFFQLGGHSLLASQLLARIYATTGAELSLNTLLDAPTPASCAAYIAHHAQATQPSSQLSSSPTSVQPDPANRFKPFPTTDVQQAYWTGRNIAVNSVHFGNHGYIEVAADELSIERFNLAMQRLIQRHEMLRAVLLPDGQQQILPIVPPFAATLVDLREQDETEIQNSLRLLRQQMDHQLLPVEHWPAFDIRIVLLSEKRAQVHLSIESLFIDAWSMHLLVQEFIQLYHNPSYQFPALELSFRDYILAEQRLHDTQSYQQARQYWQERIASLPPAPDLPLQPKAPDEPRFVHYEASLDKEHWTRLKARAAQLNVTPSGVLLTAFADILATWSKHPRFSINLSIFHRLPLHPQIHDIVGDFTSLIVLAIDTTAGETFAQRARYVQKQLWQDLDYSAYNGVQVLRELAHRQGDMLKAVMPIVFSSLLIQDMANRETPPWQNTLYALSQTPQVWLDHQVLEAGGKLIFHWQVIESLFPPGMIAAMFSAYQQLLYHLTTDDSDWHAASMVSLPTDQLTQFTHTNATEVPLEHALLHELFTRQVPQHENHPAVITEHHSLSYRQIHNAAIRLGNSLRKMGVQTNQLVAVVMEKGWEQVVAVLGILYAGAAYLPIDATLPTERVHYLLANGLVDIALTQPHMSTRTNWPTAVQRLCIDSSYLEYAEVSYDFPVQHSNDLAYVIYTSGSTGQPKGVMIDHQGAVNTIVDINQRFHIDSHDRIFALSALNFDLSVYDIFGALAAGATIVIPPETALRDPAVWLSMLLEKKVTVWNSVPALLQMLIDYTALVPDALQVSHLRLALLSGDWIPLPLPELVKTRVPAIQVVSLGGATEASIWSIFHIIETIDPTWKSIPYGRPLHNQRFFILNEKNEPCPLWVPGQIYIGGIGLARGYWHDPERTQASFIHHPQTGERLYKTGDLGRYLPDGQIEFLGREDFQVKIHGHRIELGEIENTLLQHPDVLAAVATVAAPTEETQKHLLAYVTLRPQPVTPLSQDVSQAREMVTASMSSTSSTSLPSQPFHYHIASNTSAHMDLQFGLSSTRDYTHQASLRLQQPATLSPAYTQRLSQRTFRKEPIPFEHFSAFMHTLATVEIDGLPKYRYPSAGAIYPVQVYLSVKPGRIEGVSAGMYYYHPHMHQLVLLSDYESLPRTAHTPVNQNIFDQSAFSLFFVGDLDAITPTYGDAARDFCLLEAGYMGQLLMMEATHHSLGLCPIGDMAFEALRPLLSLGDHHIFLHTMLGGSLDTTRTNGWSFTTKNSQPTKEDMADTLRHFLQDRLPAYMVPSAIVVLDSLPLTANGKVDRQHLPAPSLPQPGRREATGPHTDLEASITQLLTELLPDSAIGLDDNFFEIGGNSLIIVRLYTGMQKLYQLNASIETFFQHQTVRSLAKALQTRQ